MKKTITLEALARLVEGDLNGNGGREITGFGPLDSAGPGDISFLVKVQYLQQAEKSRATAFLVSKNIELEDKDVIKVDDVYLASAIIQNYFLEQPFVAGGIDDTATVGSGCDLGTEVTIGPQVVIGNRVKIGERVEIGAGAVLGDEVVIGNDSRIRPNVTIEPGCELGERVVVHPGTVIGSDGYGYATNKQGFHIKRPQLGTVKIGDDVEIGSNCCIDRATFGTTWIKSGTKIDNLVQIAHNVVVGENSLIVSQVGISGSTTIGRNVVFAGKSSAAGHQQIGDGSMVAGMAAVHGDQPAGSRLAGVPAIEAKQWMKSVTQFAKLPEMAKDIRRIKKELARLADRVESTSGED